MSVRYYCPSCSNEVKYDGHEIGCSQTEINRLEERIEELEHDLNTRISSIEKWLKEAPFFVAK